MGQNAIELYREESPLINDAIDRIVVQFFKRKSPNNGKMIVLTGCSPASGTTAISISLAIALSLSGRKTLLIDCDLRKSGYYKRLGAFNRSGLSDFLAGKVNKDDIIHNTNFKSMDYIACGVTQRSPVRLLSSTDMAELIASLKKEYEYIIADTPSITVSPDADILFPAVDGIVLVAGLGQTTKKQIWDARLAIQEFMDIYYGLIINRVDLKEYRSHIKDYDYFTQSKMERKYKCNLKLIKRKRKSGKNQVDIHE